MLGAALPIAAALSVAAVASADCPPDQAPTWIEQVRTKGAEPAYLCLSATDAALPALRDALPDDGLKEEDGGSRRVQRALALHLMQRLDAPVDGEDVHRLNAADRRFLRDAVQARRGRKSPIPAHHTVFSKFDWYQPDPGYTIQRLTPLDQDNLATIDRPPAPEEPADPAADAPAADAVVAPTTAQPPAETWCGSCSTGPAGTSMWWIAVGMLGLVRRRR